MRVLASYNIKGGVGKTSTAVNLAYLAARSGARTLLCDLDPQGAATYCFRIKPRVKGGGKTLVRGKRPLTRHIRATDYEGLDLLPADVSYRHLDRILDGPDRATRLARRIRPLADHYDYLFLDCAPGLSLVAEAVFGFADALLVPTIPTPLSLRTLKQLARHLRRGRLAVRVFPFFSTVDVRKRLHRTICDAADQMRIPMLATRVPYSSDVEQMSSRRAPLASFSTTRPAARAYAELWAELETRLSDQRPKIGP